MSATGTSLHMNGSVAKTTVATAAEPATIIDFFPKQPSHPFFNNRQFQLSATDCTKTFC